MSLTVADIVKETRGSVYSDLSSLDYAFDLGDDVTDPKLRMLYESIVQRMRTEAAHLPMNTVQQLVIERIARCYILLLQWERTHTISPSEHRKYTEFWIKMSMQFNATLMRATPSEQRDAFLGHIATVIAGVMQEITDKKLREDLLGRFMLAFKEEGLH